jgi:hypothetical protein
MGVPINYWAVLVAAIAQFVLGWLWYGPLFGKPWMKMMGISQASMTAGQKKGMGWRMALMFVGSLLMAYVLAHAIIFAGEYTATSGSSAGLMAAFWNWLGFFAPVLLGSVLWENKSWKLWALNAGYYLVGLCIMALILANWI